MNKNMWLLVLISPLAQAEPSVELSPAKAFASMQVKAFESVNIDKWQQAPVRLGASHLRSNSPQTAGDESEINLSMAWNSPGNSKYLESLENGLNRRQILSGNYQNWLVAGELRRQWANLARLAAQQDAQNAKVKQLSALLSDIRAAFTAREITRIELLSIENAFTDATNQAEVTKQQLQIAEQAYREFSGQRQWPLQWQETAKAADWQQHPLLILHHLDTQLAENLYVRDSSGNREPWQTNLIVKKTEGVGSLPSDTALGLQVSVPFGDAAGAEQSVQAQQQMHNQQALLAEVTRQVRASWFDAKALVATSELQRKAAQEQSHRGQEVLAAANAALSSREITHTEWLRLFLQAHELEQKSILAEISYHSAIADFNQAGGLLW